MSKPRANLKTRINPEFLPAEAPQKFPVAPLTRQI
jgi:hypothetical protein